MTDKLPKHVLDGNILTTTDGKKIELASKQWQDFIQKVKPNSFWVVVGGEIEGYSCRRESINNGDRWYAYKRIRGKLKKRYVCSDEDMALNPTRAMFQEMAKALTQPVKPRKSSKAIALKDCKQNSNDGIGRSGKKARKM
ncbi:MAG: hypothetical protein J7647_10555 [Cyanobacteria bacterium SBLK]|nr:hypothetical protein [Cyanobacteria bacterium SBLK]